jgi:hypothetical protein
VLIGNFAAQYFKADPSYMVAVERSYFQGVALLGYWIVDKFVWREK